MELRQLRYLVMLAEERHFTRAAQRLQIAQPGLSQQIRKLEEEVRTPLVDRTTRHVALTDAGERVAARARSILGELEAMQSELDQMRGLRTGRVVAGVTPTPGPLGVATLLGRFRAANPEIDLVLREGFSATLAEALRADSIDCAFTTWLTREQRRGLASQEVASEPLVAVLPHGHPMARRKRLSLKDLAGEDFVLFSEGATIRALVNRTSERLGFRPHVSFEAGETSRIRSIVAEGLGVSVLPRSDALTPGPPVAVADLSDPDMVHRVFVVHRAGRRHGPAVRAFLELVDEAT